MADSPLHLRKILAVPSIPFPPPAMALCCRLSNFFFAESLSFSQVFSSRTKYLEPKLSPLYSIQWIHMGILGICWEIPRVGEGCCGGLLCPTIWRNTPLSQVQRGKLRNSCCVYFFDDFWITTFHVVHSVYLQNSKLLQKRMKYWRWGNQTHSLTSERCNTGNPKSFIVEVWCYQTSYHHLMTPHGKQVGSVCWTSLAAPSWLIDKRTSYIKILPNNKRKLLQSAKLLHEKQLRTHLAAQNLPSLHKLYQSSAQLPHFDFWNLNPLVKFQACRSFSGLGVLIGIFRWTILDANLRLQEMPTRDAPQNFETPHLWCLKLVTWYRWTFLEVESKKDRFFL